MNSKNHENDLPRIVASKLRAIQRRAVIVTLLQGFLRALTVFLAAMLIAMLLDWAIGWFDIRARVTLTALAIIV